MRPRSRWKAIDASGEVNAVYVHLAEGIDVTSRDEFNQLEAKGLLTPADGDHPWHGAGCGELDEVAAAGAKLVWSPQCNLGSTARQDAVKGSQGRKIGWGLARTGSRAAA